MSLVFKDRRSAGEQLAARLGDYANKPETVVTGLARGGVVVAHAVAQVLHLPLDVIIIRKIGAPYNEELAIGAVDENGHAIFNTDMIQQLGISPLYVKEETESQKILAQKRAALYRSGRKKRELKGKTVIVVDDGIATGASMRAAIDALRHEGVKKIVMAVPVAAPDSFKELALLVDEAVCIESPSSFSAVGQFYEEFDQTSDDEVKRLLFK